MQDRKAFHNSRQTDGLFECERAICVLDRERTASHCGKCLNSISRDCDGMAESVRSNPVDHKNLWELVSCVTAREMAGPRWNRTLRENSLLLEWQKAGRFAAANVAVLAGAAHDQLGVYGYFRRNATSADAW